MARLEEQTSPLACTPSLPPTLPLGVHPARGAAPAHSAFQGRSSLLLGQPFNFSSESPSQALSPNTEALWPPALPWEHLRACPHPGRVAAGPIRLQKQPGEIGSRGRFAPHSPWWGCVGARAPSGITTSTPPASHRRDVGDTPRGTEQSPHPPHTHIPVALPFGVAAAGEFQLFQHLYLFWLPLLFRPRYKLKAALLLTSSKLHLLTSLPRLLAGRGLLLTRGQRSRLGGLPQAKAARFSPLAWLGTGCQQRLLAKGACHR